MAQEGVWNFVPDQITGAATSDFTNYIGATKGGRGGAQYVLCYNTETVSLADGIAVQTQSATANSAYDPWGIASTSGNGFSAPAGILAGSCNAGGLCWVQVAGTTTVSVVSGTSSAAYGIIFNQTNTSQVYSTGATSQLLGDGSDITAAYNRGILGPKFLVNAKYLASNVGSATVQIVPQSIYAALTTA